MAAGAYSLAGHSMGQDAGTSSLAATGSLKATMSQPGYTGSVPVRATLSGSTGSRKLRKRKGAAGSRAAPSQEAVGLLSQAEVGSSHSPQHEVSVRVGRSISQTEELWEWEEALESLTVSRVENWLSVVAQNELTSRSPASLLHPHLSRRAWRARLQPHSERIASPFRTRKPSKSGEPEGPPSPRARAAAAAEAEPALESVGEREGGAAVAEASAEAQAEAKAEALAEASVLVLTSSEAEVEVEADASIALLSHTESQQAVRAAEPYKYLLLSMAIFATPASVCFAGVVLCPLLAVPAILAWFVAETVFIPLRAIQLRWASHDLIEHPVPEAHEQKELFERVLQLRHHGIKPDQFLSRWFHGTPISNLSRDDVTNFLSCSFYHRQYTALPPHIQSAVRDKVERLEEVLETKFRHDEEEVLPPVKGVVGWLGSWFQRRPKKAAPMPFMAHTMEPLKAVVHPLAVYAWGHWVGHLTVSAMSSMGFTQHVSKATGFRYFILRRASAPAASSKAGKAEEVPADEACVFIHGLGVGITPYLVFVHQLISASPHKTIAVLELPHLAFRLCSEIPSVERLVEGVDEVLEEACPGGQASIIGHSYGSLVAAHFVRTRPTRVASLGLIDPVSILLCLPDVVYNFIYKPAESAEDLFRSIMVSKELNVAQALCRVFNWHSLLLWAHQMPEQSVVMLSGKDSIVPSPEVRSYLDAHSIPVIYNENLKHAEFLVCPDLQKKFLEMLYQPKAAWARAAAPVPV